MCLCNQTLKAIPDWDFTKKVKKQTNKVMITTSKLYHHEENTDLQTYLEKKKKYFGTFKEYINKWGLDDEDIKKQLSPIYRLFGVFFEKGKFWKLITHPLLTLGMYYVRFRIAMNYALHKKGRI